MVSGTLGVVILSCCSNATRTDESDMARYLVLSKDAPLVVWTWLKTTGEAENGAAKLTDSQESDRRFPAVFVVSTVPASTHVPSASRCVPASITM